MRFVFVGKQMKKFKKKVFKKRQLLLENSHRAGNGKHAEVCSSTVPCTPVL